MKSSLCPKCGSTDIRSGEFLTEQGGGYTGNRNSRRHRLLLQLRCMAGQLRLHPLWLRRELHRRSEEAGRDRRTLARRADDAARPAGGSVAPAAQCAGGLMFGCCGPCREWYGYTAKTLQTPASRG